MIVWDCDAILFDLDGVLVDSTACVEHHWRQWALRHGFDVPTVLRYAHGMRTVDMIRLLAPHLPASNARRYFFNWLASFATGANIVLDGGFTMQSLVLVSQDEIRQMNLGG